MKRKGSCSYFIEQRNEELRRACRKEVMSAGYKRLSDVWETIVEQPTSRFFVSEERMTTLVRHRLRHGQWPAQEKLNATRYAMYEEVWRRYLLQRAEHPQKPIDDIVHEIVNSQAPSFYLTPGSARAIFYRI